ncbi:MAG: DDE-type integrase/transposase/recombinase [Candidatus Woesearchaeota archaeon]|jgi:putative transposase
MGYTKKFKERVLKHVNLGITPIEHIAQIRKIPKQTIYRWIKLKKKYGNFALENKKPGAKQIQIIVTFENKILLTWKLRNSAVNKMWRKLKTEGFDVSERQIQKIYRKHGLKMNKRTRPSQIKFVRYEWPKPNMLWHTDWTECPFTGKYLIAFIDDNSRFIVHAEYFENMTAENTILAFKIAILKHGKPERILTDQGTQFTPTRGEIGSFTKFCNDNEIQHILGRIHHPQTNGKIERWFGTYKLEFKDGEDTLDTFLKFYNEERLHQGIGYKIPLEKYKSNINTV